MKTYEEFKEEVQQVIANRPSHIRKGQEVFNYIDRKYGVARFLQYKLGVDCYHNDDNIDHFVKTAYKVLTEEM